MAWRIISSRKIVHDYAQLCQLATSQGRLQLVLDAMTVLHERLSTDPLEAGEPHYRLKHLGLIMCVAFREPLTVDYAVDEQRRWVYLRGITLKD